MDEASRESNIMAAYTIQSMHATSCNSAKETHRHVYQFLISEKMLVRGCVSCGRTEVTLAYSPPGRWQRVKEAEE